LFKPLTEQVGIFLIDKGGVDVKNKELRKKLKQKIEDNFFGIIIILALFLTIVLIISLFTPISRSGIPETRLELDKYNVGINQRIILVRSISYIISGISVVIAFVSLMQSKNSDLKREWMQVIPFPAYAIPLEDNQYTSKMSSKLIIKKECPDAQSILQTKFDITIKNIGLKSLVDYEINKAYYRATNGELQDLPVSFFSNFILGKGETIRIGINIVASFESEETTEQKNLEAISISGSLTDLLGHCYIQEFTILSEVHFVGHQKFTMTDGTEKTRTVYSLNPKEITHTHPSEQ
jgi:hypothetical protein